MTGVIDNLPGILGVIVAIYQESTQPRISA